MPVRISNQLEKVLFSIILAKFEFLNYENLFFCAVVSGTSTTSGTSGISQIAKYGVVSFGLIGLVFGAYKLRRTGNQDDYDIDFNYSSII